MLRRWPRAVNLMRMNPYIEQGIVAVRAAEAVILRYWEQGVEARVKADKTPVTAADEEAEQAIVALLGEAFPEHGFYGEEGGYINPDAEWLWLIDPLDGTKSFVRGQPFFSTQLALMHRGALVAGISNAPVAGELAWAARGEGAWLNGQRVAVSGTDSLAAAVLSTGNLSTLARGDGWAALGRLVPRLDRVRGYGDYCHYHLLARGALDVVLESDLNILDIAALSVIVEEAGGHMTDMHGGALTLETTSALATNGKLHEQVLGELWN